MERVPSHVGHVELVVRDAQEGDDIEFDYFVQGIRLGYTDFEVERPVR